jgi:hypothetical protein
VNGTRVGQAYIDEESAIKKGSKFKDPLAESTLICYLQYGANLEGYWSYEDVIIQFEDAVDCLKYPYPQYDFYFMFDHSNGHDRIRPDGLNMSKISKYYGGSQPHMRDTLITDDNVGPHTTSSTVKLKSGDVQKCTFM